MTRSVHPGTSFWLGMVILDFCNRTVFWTLVLILESSFVKRNLRKPSPPRFRGGEDTKEGSNHDAVMFRIEPLSHGFVHQPVCKAYQSAFHTSERPVLGVFSFMRYHWLPFSMTGCNPRKP
jgi:hypothetical protein